MNTLGRLFTILVLLSGGASAGLAQQQQKEEFLVPIPEKLVRATTTDEEGLKVWEEFKPERCVNCKGKKTMQCLHCARFDEGDAESCPECKNTKVATCRLCAGTGEMHDILERAPCPTCQGAAQTTCYVCGGRGRFPVEGGGKKPANCGCCDGVGAYKCQTCAGKRYVDPPAIKPSVAEGKSKDLKKAIAALEAVTAALEKFDSTGDGRKDIKLHASLVAPGTKLFPPLARAHKHFEAASKDQTKGAVWKAYADMVKNQATATKQALEYYLKHQRRVLDLCLEFAEHNETLRAQKK